MTASKSRRARFLIALLIALSLFAAACGDDGDDGGDAGEDGGTGEGGDFSGVTISVSGSEVGTEADGSVSGFAPFEEATGANVEYQGSRDFETQIRVAYEGGTLPDVALFPQPGNLEAFIDKVPGLPEDIVETLNTDYNPFWAELVTYDGKVAGVPLKADVKSLVWYSPAVFEENGYEIPESWDDLIALQEQAKEDGLTPWCIGIESGAATGWVLTDWMEDLMLRAHGPDVYDQWVNHEIPFDDPQVKEVAEMIGEIWFDDENVSGGRGSIVSTGFGASPVGLVAGDCLMHRQGNFAAANIVAEAPDATFGPDGDFDAFRLPDISDEFGTLMLSGGNYAVAFNDEPATVAFMKHLASSAYSNARLEANVGGFISPNETTDDSLYPSDLDRQFADLLTSSDVVRFDGADLMPGEVGSGSFWKEGTNWVSGTIDTDEFLSAVEDSWPAG
jgi:alpha-glucoside transport system substrate-binding protein